jgi:hypothetical protein
MANNSRQPLAPMTVEDMRYYQDDNTRRRNSESDDRGLQYHTPRGSVPAQIAIKDLRRTPAPPGPSRGGFPHVYRNSEGRKPNTRTNFQEWERHPNENRLFEVAVHTPNPTGYLHDVQKTPLKALQEPTDPEKRKIWRRNQLTAPKPSEPGYGPQVMTPPKVWTPPNDPGFHRAVTNQRGDRIIGAMYHPVGNPRGFERSPLEPLDRRGREAVRRHDDMTPRPMEQGVNRQGSWPPRGDGREWDERS